MTDHKAHSYNTSPRRGGFFPVPVSAVFVVLVVFFVGISVALLACSESSSTGPEMGEHETNGGESGEGGEGGSGEHGEGGEGAGSESGEGGEESGNALTKDQTFDSVRKGARLVLRYDSTADAFVGMVSNTTDSTLVQVRVEVHLSNGTELGPTTPVDLAPGASVPVTLSAMGESFDGWTPHAEVGPSSGSGGEHGSGGESGEGSGESGEGSGESGEGSGGEHGGSGEGGGDGG